MTLQDDLFRQKATDVALTEGEMVIVELFNGLELALHGANIMLCVAHVLRSAIPTRHL